MANPTICTEPGCGGAINPITLACKKCRTIYDENPEAVAFAEEQGGGQAGGKGGGRIIAAKPVLSTLSRRSDVQAEPTSLADVTPVLMGARRVDDGVSLLALRATLGGTKVKMPAVASVDRLAQVKLDLLTPPARRICSNVKCVTAGVEPGNSGNDNRTKLYWPSRKVAKMPPNCRLEEETNAATGEVTTFFVPDLGYCSKCGTKFNFLPMKPGTIIDQFRVDGQFAYGGDGMLYHGMDTELNTPVVIKALHNATNVKSLRVASQEVGALVALQGQPGVLRVCGFKELDKQPLIIMEWLNGATLFDVRVAQSGPLPIEVGLSYLMGAIAAIRVGHDMKPAILHLDIKPENFIALAPGDHMKVIDYGGCHIEGREKQDVVTTDGFSAPELEPNHPINGGKTRRPSKASDVFALGRLFCFLSLPFSLKGKYRFMLPTPGEEPIFAELESVYRFVRRLTAIDPDERMTLAEAYEAADALRNEVIALKDRRALLSVSTAFAADTTKETELTFKTLPQLLIDGNDQAARQVEEAIAFVDLKRQRQVLEQILVEQPESKEAKLRLAALATDTGDLDFAKRLLEQLSRKDPFDWRNVYHLGRLALAGGEIEQAARCFDACYSARPADVAIKLPNGLCAELAGNNAVASRFYETVAWVNPDYTAGPFGWARVATKEGDLATAIEAYNRVPRTSWAFRQAVIGKVQALIHILSSASASGIGLPELQEAADSAEFVIAEGESFEAHRLQADVFKAAIAALGAGAVKSDKTITLLGVPMVPRFMRKAASQSLLSCGRLASDRCLRIDLVDEARRVAGFKLF
jgi:serine/threonine-protein kinase PknG